ncbi:MAG: ATP-grasp domain-containing protein [Promethearchaeota archaeon]|nr:MAG: ATP-grasp domain-containing protein [Candidatus Lokiarchaeota archaeon]
MVKKSNSVLIVGFNTRPLAYSLNRAGYEVYAVDFFGDLDLYPNVRDCIIIIKKLRAKYNTIKETYSEFLVNFTIEMLQKYPSLENLIIGSGLDDAFDQRKRILNEINKKQYNIKNLNNDLEIITKARDILDIFEFLTSKGYRVPLTFSFDNFETYVKKFKFPFMMKKKTGAGGLNVYKIENENEFSLFIKLQEVKGLSSSEWLIQEYLEGIPVSCTTISNGKECEIVSINRQIIGEKFVNPPKEFMYCGNITPANLFKEDEKLISEISKTLANELHLKGINGFDFVLKDHYPYLMEINPRIPGSIRVSEVALKINLLDLHIKSFDISQWENVKNIIKNSKPEGFATKLIMFAPKNIYKDQIEKINLLRHVHDKPEQDRIISKEEPVCTVLFKAKTFSNSYFGALKIIDKIKEIIGG